MKLVETANPPPSQINKTNYSLFAKEALVVYGMIKLRRVDEASDRALSLLSHHK
jgi:hypothetical protein